MAHNSLDITNQKFHRLTATRLVGTNKHKKAVWEFICDCGEVVTAVASQVKSGNTQSCGCLRIDRTKKHGKSGEKIWSRWRAMVRRCTDERAKGYHNYGGRGIKVCDRWMLFDNFYNDIGDPPFDGAELDRIDNNGDYEPGNVRWVTKAENSRNRRTSILLTGFGETKTLSEWARQMGMAWGSLHHRAVIKGESVEDIAR